MLISYFLYRFFAKHLKNGVGDRWAYPLGFLSGCLEGALSSGGPLAIIYTSLKSWSNDRIKVTLQGYFILTETMTVVLHAVSGVTTLYVLRLFGVSLPALILGTYVGELCYGKLNDEIYKQIILIILAFLGVFMIYLAINPSH
jgi:uncharacterized membrane protein YfcA